MERDLSMSLIPQRTRLSIDGDCGSLGSDGSSSNGSTVANGDSGSGLGDGDGRGGLGDGDWGSSGVADVGNGLVTWWTGWTL